jgi:hypothetical protein
MEMRMKRKTLVFAIAIAVPASLALAHADPFFRNRPEWLDLRKGVQAFTGIDGGDALYSLTVCGSKQTYTKWIDSADTRPCSVHSAGVPVSITSDEIISIAADDAMEFAVFIRADDSSWSGWTSNLGLHPRIPARTKLETKTYDNPLYLAAQQDSDSKVGESLVNGTALELISQDPKNDELYVKVVGDGRFGWLSESDVQLPGGLPLVLYPSSPASVTYEFDCHLFLPRSHFYDTGDYGAAFTEIVPFATPECPEAEHLLGVMYGKGQGVQKDSVHAFALLLLAYNKGMRPFGEGVAKVPVLSPDPNEFEIVHFGATLSTSELSNAERLASHLDENDAAAIRDTMQQLRHWIARYSHRLTGHTLHGD